MKYAEVSDVEAGFRPLSDDEATRCDAMLEEAAVIIDAYNKEAAADAKSLSPAGWCADSLTAERVTPSHFLRERRRVQWRLSDIHKAGP